MPDLDITTMQITDEDLVPLNLFGFVISQIENKISERNKTISRFISECKNTVRERCLKVEKSEKLRKIAEENVLITHVNKKMEDNNDAYFTDNYRHRTLYYVFIKSNTQSYRNSKEFQEIFLEVFKVKNTLNKYYNDYKRKLEAEKDKFNGRVQAGDGAETASNMTSATKLTGKSGKSILTKRGPLSKDSSPERASSVRRGDDDLDEAATLKGGFK